MDVTVTPRSAIPMPQAGQALWGLVWLSAAHEPGRAGELVLVPPGRTCRLGRLPASPGEYEPHLEWARQRPGGMVGTGPARTVQLSRDQLVLEARSECLYVKNIGKATLSVGGRTADEVEAVEGMVLEIGELLSLLVVRRPLTLPGPRPAFAFGEPDGWGLVGESPAMWDLRRQVAFAAARGEHVLVTGPSGSGKEAVARALHASSARHRGPFVARSAATLPESLIEVELFGHAKNFPQHGMPERLGLVGEADGGTLFLDEIGEVSEAMQARLLRLLDDGEYHRLGEGRPRRADVRMVAATNRDPLSLKHDLLARLVLRVEVPGLGERPDDVALLVDAMIRRLVADDPAAIAHLELGEGELPRLHPALAAELVRHRWTTHVRELRAALWSALAEGSGPLLDRARLEVGAPVDDDDLSAERVQAVLDKHGGAQEPTWRELGLSSRHALARLVKKFGLRVRGRSG